MGPAVTLTPLADSGSRQSDESAARPGLKCGAAPFAESAVFQRPPRGSVSSAVGVGTRHAGHARRIWRRGRFHPYKFSTFQGIELGRAGGLTGGLTATSESGGAFSRPARTGRGCPGRPAARRSAAAQPVCTLVSPARLIGAGSEWRKHTPPARGKESAPGRAPSGEGPDSV